MNTAVIITKTEPDIKRQAQEIAREFGISLSSLVNAFLKQVVRTRRVEFSVEEKPSEYLVDVIKKAEENYRKGRYSPAFTNANDAVKYLEKQGI
ncbi:type II toxin-antitoxin system RelB/DinJ family antitoxin [Candidatus Amesbacteria bacterium]|nr:type II toxin-antitoxin system RelB/DinJ family antitoxin [Candidatus Amesbacteria bacterium]MBI2587488.1 type II toxin-antitoxin system RelB/DinJ family antitoxin [Candidatus Amesbacteria bacterium]